MGRAVVGVDVVGVVVGLVTVDVGFTVGLVDVTAGEVAGLFILVGRFDDEVVGLPVTSKPPFRSTGLVGTLIGGRLSVGMSSSAMVGVEFAALVVGFAGVFPVDV